MRVTYLGQLVAEQDGLYKMYVFKNLDEKDNSLLKYFTVTQLPNWNIENIKIGDIGYVECDYVNAGETYYKSSTSTTERYNYTICYLLNFIKQKEIINKKEFNF